MNVDLKVDFLRESKVWRRRSFMFFATILIEAGMATLFSFLFDFSVKILKI